MIVIVFGREDQHSMRKVKVVDEIQKALGKENSTRMVRLARSEGQTSDTKI